MVQITSKIFLRKILLTMTKVAVTIQTANYVKNEHDKNWRINNWMKFSRGKAYSKAIQIENSALFLS